MNRNDIPTPALLIDKNIMMDNLKFMQDYADSEGVHLRPHTKTHKMPYVALIQKELGAHGVTVAKTDEAEIMSQGGIDDIFIANEIIGEDKLEKIKELSKTINISFGLDSIEGAFIVNKAFEGHTSKAQVLIEIEVGEERSGMNTMEEFSELLVFLKDNCPNIKLLGIFSHDGSSYFAENLEELAKIHRDAQIRTLSFAKKAEELGYSLERVSIGSTPSLMHGFPILKGVTEIRPGTYVFMDASQANGIGSKARCAATVLAQVMSRPTEERVILDVGAKGITMQKRSRGLCSSEGLGDIKEFPGVHVFDVFDEHAIIYSKEMKDSVKVGDKVSIIPVHICPVVNLHENAYFMDGDRVIETVPVLGRGKLR